MGNLYYRRDIYIEENSGASTLRLALLAGSNFIEVGSKSLNKQPAKFGLSYHGGGGGGIRRTCQLWGGPNVVYCFS